MHWVPHLIFRVLYTILYENEFQNYQIFYQPVRFSPKRSTLVGAQKTGFFVSGFFISRTSQYTVHEIDVHCVECDLSIVRLLAPIGNDRNLSIVRINTQLM
jgi:hypothetical protein